MTKKQIKKFQEVMLGLFLFIFIVMAAVMSMSMKCGDHTTASVSLICVGASVLGIVSCTM